MRPATFDWLETAIFLLLCLIALVALMAGCSTLSPSMSIATTQPVGVEQNTAKSWLSSVIQLFTRTKSVTVHDNSGPVTVQQDGWRYAVLAGAVLLLWLVPSGWPFRRRKQHLVIEFKLPKESDN